MSRFQQIPALAAVLLALIAPLSARTSDPSPQAERGLLPADLDLAYSAD